MNEYINVEAMRTNLFELLKGVRESFRDDENSSFLDDNFSDDYLDEISWEKAEEFNSDMKKYLHQKDHKICGNFNNIEYDYNLFRYGEVASNLPLLNDMINRLDHNCQDEQTKKDRDFLNGWIFETYGTFGITYNFGDEISERQYEYEEEMAMEIA